jgi:hypothetical protein
MQRAEVQRDEANAESDQTSQPVGDDCGRGASADPWMQNENKAAEHDWKYGENASQRRTDPSR